MDIPTDKTLNALDQFLRKIWLECCGHMSEFQGVGKGTKVGKLRTGDWLLHLYDFGCTTQTLITVIGTTWRPPQKEAVRLLSRNVPPQFFCRKCGAPAEYIKTDLLWANENPFYCKKCAGKYTDEEMLLPVTNSPRMGVCGYCGELDTFAFVQPDCTPVSAPRTSAPQKLRKQPENSAPLYPDELYELAFAFRLAKPWDRLREDELFAIPLPNGETGYCSVMGRGGQHFALTVYPGEPGLRSFQRMQEMERAFNRFEMPNQLKVQEHLLSQLWIVTNDRTHAFLEALADSLEITLVQTDWDDLLEELEDEFAARLMDGGFDDLDEEDTAELAAGLLTDFDDSELLQLPQAVWENLRTMLNEGNASAEAKDRFYELNEKRRSLASARPSKPNPR